MSPSHSRCRRSSAPSTPLPASIPPSPDTPPPSSSNGTHAASAAADSPSPSPPAALPVPQSHPPAPPPPSAAVHCRSRSTASLPAAPALPLRSPPPPASLPPAASLSAWPAPPPAAAHPPGSVLLGSSPPYTPPRSTPSTPAAPIRNSSVGPPRDSRLASAYSTTNTAGCPNHVWFSCPLPPPPSPPPPPPRKNNFCKSRLSPPPSPPTPYITSRKSIPICPFNNSQHSATASRNPGSLPHNPAPHFSYCSPIPGNRNTTGRSRLSWYDVHTFLASVVSKASAAPRTPLAPEQTTTLRWLNALRPTCSVKAASARFIAGSLLNASASSSVAFSNAVSVLADSISNCDGRLLLVASSSHSSRITYALVPPKPKELTPARRGPP